VPLALRTVRLSQATLAETAVGSYGKSAVGTWVLPLLPLLLLAYYTTKLCKGMNKSYYFKDVDDKRLMSQTRRASNRNL